MAKRKTITLTIVIAGFVIFLGIQALPYGGDHSNPPVISGPNWDSPQTEQLVRRACFDCHSNETRWPWYSYVAPVSWRVAGHVEQGRRHLNFSEFNKPQRRAHDAAEEVEAGEMPLWDYALMHSEARLSDSEKEVLIRGLKATFGERPPRGESSH